jgi:sulfatase maturation enzyme AslB (radical SAM superfamily)
MSDGASYVLSPYLQTLAAPESGDPGMRWLREQLARDAPPADIVIIADLLTRRIIATTPEMEQRVARLRDREFTSVAVAADPALARLRALGVIASSEDLYRKHAYTSLEIEINRHCNLRCRFCPVAIAPKPKAFMPAELFTLLLQRAVEYGIVKISMNHYSEPTLNPDLIQRIEEAASHRLTVRLHTNATLLDETKVRRLADAGNVELVINIPSVDPVEYERVTGTKLFDRVMANLELIHQHQLSTTLSINSPRDSADQNVRMINDKFESWFGPSVAWPTDNRAGLLEHPEYARPVSHAGRLNGCLVAIYQLNVSFEGKAFLCCQDFDQQYILGDLRESSIAEIASSERAVEIRRMILGGQTAPADFLCRRCEWTQPLSRTRDHLAVGSTFKASAHLGVQGLLLEWPIDWLEHAALAPWA